MRVWLRMSTPRAVGALLWGVTFLSTCHVLGLGISNEAGHAMALTSFVFQIISPVAQACYEKPHVAMQHAHTLLSAAMLVMGGVMVSRDPLLATLLGQCAVLHAALRVLWLPTPRPPHPLVGQTYPTAPYTLNQEDHMGSMAVDL